MTDTRGTFRLKEVRQDILNNEYVSMPSIFIANDNFGHGHFFDGQLRRYNVSNSTVGKAGPTSFVRYHDTGGGSREHTYWSGGGSNTSTISKLVYSTYTTTASLPIKVLSSARNQMASVSKNTDVYYTGGNYPSVPAVSTTQKLTFSNDSIALLPGSHYPKSNGEDSMASFNDGGTYGYFWGGTVGTTDTKVMRLTFSNDTMAALPGTTYPSGQAPAYSGMWNLGNTTKGYNVGGVWVSYTKKLTYATETFVYAPGANYPNSIGQATAFTAGADTGLVNSGRSPADRSDTNLLTFSTDSWAAAPAMNNPDISSMGNDYGSGTGTSARDSKIGNAPNYTMDGSKKWIDGSGESPNNSYILHGSSLGGDTYKLDFSTETGADTPSARTPTHRNRLAGTGNKTQGYFCSGYYSGSTPYVRSNTDKLFYSSDSCFNLPTSSLPGINGLQYHSAISSDTDGYFWAGLKEYPTVYNWTKIYKITYATDVMSTHPSNMTSSNYRGASTNSATAGYETGGASLGDTAIKFTFSTGTAETKSGFMTNVSQPRTYCNATGNQTAGYWAGGSNYSRVAKVTWATETAEWLPGNLVEGSLTRMNATSNTEKGYWIGGYPQPGGKTNVTTFATDTSERSPSVESLSPAFTSTNDIIRASVGGRQSGIPVSIPPAATPTASTTEMGAAERGYIFGGNPGPLDTIDKLDMSTETISSTGSTLEENNKRMVCFGNTTTAYATGSASPMRSWIQKFVYSTDVRTKLPATLQGARGYMGGISNNTIGYTMGGTPGNKKQMDKFVMATETNSAIPDMPATRYRNCTWGSDTTGYTGSGYPSPYMQTVNKITYSNDTQSNTTNLSRSTTLAAGVSNATIGYIVGGEQSKTAVDKWTMSSDSCSRVPSADLPASRYAWEQANNTPTKGYFVGGAPGSKTDTFVLTFSSDSTALSPTCFVSTISRSGAGAAGPNQRGNAGSNLQPNII